MAVFSKYKAVLEVDGSPMSVLTAMTLPKYRAPDGTRMTAVTLPDELKGPMGDVVMAAAIEAGILVEKQQ
ncbi:hypothetical protein WV31_20870 [Magnetospirillum sp. ME-1]|nr:hypothetical protein WV31_20870 [Magnetospirillum sp. ME-1]